MTGPHVTALGVYPVKSLDGVALEASRVSPRGLAGDRRWGVVEPDGTKLTAREVPALLGLTARPGPGCGIEIEDRAGARLRVSPPRDATPIAVTHSSQGTARPCGREVSQWLADRVGRAVRLVWQDDDARRPIRADLGGLPGDLNSLADAAPILLTTESSLAQLNSWLAESGAAPIGQDRFRPNVVVDGDEPFAEDGWDQVTVGDVLLRATMVCDRCVMTTIDRDTLTTSKEPIRTLARHRRWEGSTWFGIRLTPVLPLAEDATIALGDPVTVVSSRRAGDAVRR